MKKIGIVGGLAWPSTVEYYAGLCRRTEQWHMERGLPPQAPEMAIESVNLAKAFSYIGTDGDAFAIGRMMICAGDCTERKPAHVRCIRRPEGL